MDPIAQSGFWRRIAIIVGAQYVQSTNPHLWYPWGQNHKIAMVNWIEKQDSARFQDSLFTHVLAQGYGMQLARYCGIFPRDTFLICLFSLFQSSHDNHMMRHEKWHTFGMMHGPANSNNFCVSGTPIHWCQRTRLLVCNNTQKTIVPRSALVGAPEMKSSF